MVEGLMSFSGTIVPFDSEPLQRLGEVPLGELNAALFFCSRRRES
jgi:hypothetical protein